MSDPIRIAYERAFTGGNRISLSWAAFQAGWNAAKQSDQAIYDSIAESYHKSLWEQRKGKAWAERDLNCGCDHNEYCGKCWPVEFRKGGEFYEWTGEPSRSLLANCAESSSSPAEQLREATRQRGHCLECHALHPQHHAKCSICDAKPGQEHVPACPRHPSDPMGVRRR